MIHSGCYQWLFSRVEVERERGDYCFVFFYHVSFYYVTSVSEHEKP